MGRYLSPRELQVLLWIAEGKRNSEIATILGVGVRTVDTHAYRLFRKLGVNKRTDAARMMLQRPDDLRVKPPNAPRPPRVKAPPPNA